MDRETILQRIQELRVLIASNPSDKEDLTSRLQTWEELRAKSFVVMIDGPEGLDGPSGIAGEDGPVD